MRGFLCLISAAGVVGAFVPLCANAEDLWSVYQQALANDPVYGAARASLAAGKEKLRQGRSGLMPNIAISGSYMKTNLEEMPSDPAVAGYKDFNSHYPQSTYTLQLTQPLFRAANWEQYQIGVLNGTLSEAQYAQAQQDLMLRTAQAYFEVLAAQDTLSSIQANKAAITEQLAAAKRNFEVGNSTIADTDETQSRYDLAVAQELAAQNALGEKVSLLEQLIGKPPGTLLPLRQGVKLTAPEPAQMAQWVEHAEQDNFNVVGQQINAEIAHRTTKANRAGHLPTVDLVASRQHTNLGGDDILYPPGISNQSEVGVQWNIPIFSGFMVDSKVQESVALEEKARQDLINARRTAAQSARQSYMGVDSGLSQIAAYEEAETSSRKALASNRLGYKMGVRINIDVLNAQQQFYATRQNLAKAKYETILNGLRLKSAAGTLKEEDLFAANGLLEHAAAYESREDSDRKAAEDERGTILERYTARANARAGAPAAAPAVHSPDASPAPGANAEETRDVLAALQTWAGAWSLRDVELYLSLYSPAFEPPGGMSREAWAEERRKRIEGRRKIDVTIEAPQVKFNADTATVSFRQHYLSDALKDDTRKVLLLAKEDGKWLIKRDLSR